MTYLVIKYDIVETTHYINLIFLNEFNVIYIKVKNTTKSKIFPFCNNIKSKRHNKIKFSLIK